MGTVNVSTERSAELHATGGQHLERLDYGAVVQAHTSATATENSAGWQELAPQLASAPMQIDLFSKPDTRCVLAQLGSASLPVGNYQQIRLLLLSNTPAARSRRPSIE